MSAAPLHKTQCRLRDSLHNKTINMATELRDCPRNFERFNTGSLDELAPDAHIPLPGVAIWEERKEEYHRKYMVELGQKMGVELDPSKVDLLARGTSECKRVTGAHHSKMMLAAKRVRQSQENLLVRLLNDGHGFRRHPVVDKWEKLSCHIGADEYLFFKLPDALCDATIPFWGLYTICHMDVEHMEGDHVLMTAMENRIAKLKYSRALFSLATFRVDLDLAELLLERLNKLEAELKVPLHQANHMRFAMMLSDMSGKMDEEITHESGVDADQVASVAEDMKSFVKTLGNEFRCLTLQAREVCTGIHSGS